MDYEFHIKEGDPATNSLMAEMVTRLSEAEEARWRELLAEAWDSGYSTGSTDCARFLGWATSEVPASRPKERTNPYRVETKD